MKLKTFFELLRFDNNSRTLPYALRRVEIDKAKVNFMA